MEISLNPTGYKESNDTSAHLKDWGKDIDVGDDGFAVEKLYGEAQKSTLLLVLTKRQQQVAELLFNGYNRPDIARNLVPPVCVQAVHQIILRIRKRMKKKAGIKIESRHTKHGHI